MEGSVDDIRHVFAYQLIPWWERYGLERLAISESTLRRFQAQPLPPSMQVSVKPRKSGKARPRAERIYNNVVTVSEVFPQDAQDTCRHPILYCVIKGRADLHIADYLVHCPAGHFMLMRPGVPQPDGSRPHLEDSSSEGYCEIMHFSLLPGSSSVGIWICRSQPNQHSGSAHFTVGHPDIVAQFHFFMREMLDQSPGYQKTASNALHNFFLLLFRELNADRLQPSIESDDSHTLSAKENAMDFALQYVENHLHLHLTSAKVAESVYMSRSNFLRHFTRATGQSFNQYLTALRLQRSRDYLTNSTLSIQAICMRVGIKPAQLYRLFKNHLGMSPSEFRQRRLRQND